MFKSLYNEKTLRRVFTITKVILCILPFAALFYVYLGTREYNLTYQELLQANPVLTLTFLTAMLQPLAVWLLTIVQRRVDDLDYSNALVNTFIIFIGECLLKNWLGIIATGVIFWLITKEMPYKISTEFKEYANWKKILLDATGGVVFCLLAAFCFYASMRLG